MADPTSIWKRPRARLYGLVAVLWLIALFVVIAAARVLLPFELAFLFAYVINPVISRIARWRVTGRPVPRWGAVLVVYFVIGAAVWFSTIALLPLVYGEVVRGLTDANELLSGLGPARFQEWAQRIQGFLQRYGLPVEVVPGQLGPRAPVAFDLAAVLADAMAGLTEWTQAQLGDLFAISRAILGGAVRTLFFVVLLLMITAFVSMDAPRIARWFASLVPTASQPDWRRFVATVDQGLAGVVRGQITICLINGLLTLVGLLLIRVPFPFALAALATVLYLVPLFGTILSSIPIVLLALGGGLSKGLLALAWIVGIHALETYVLNPKIMGHTSKIHPVLIVLSLVIGESYYGIVGALLAVPVASLVASVFKFLHAKTLELDARVQAAEAAAALAAPTAPPPPGPTPPGPPRA